MGNNISTPSLQQSSFSFATAVTGYWLYKAMKPPRPLNLDSSRDSKAYGKQLLKRVFQAVAVFRTFFLSVAALNAVVALTGPSILPRMFGQLARHTEQIDATFWTWNKISGVVIPFAAVNAAIRLHAFNELGVNFTFDLHDPNRLITTGMYKYVQHPSYTSAILSMMAGTAWFLRADGPVGAFLSPATFEVVRKYQTLHYIGMALFMTFGIGKRVSDEEEMLRKKFGREWEEWHKRTARFIPFLF